MGSTPQKQNFHFERAFVKAKIFQADRNFWDGLNRGPKDRGPGTHCGIIGEAVKPGLNSGLDWILDL